VKQDYKAEEKAIKPSVGTKIKRKFKKIFHHGKETEVEYTSDEYREDALAHPQVVHQHMEKDVVYRQI